MRCPKCDEEQPTRELCRRCGIVFYKYEQMQSWNLGGGQPLPVGDAEAAFPYQPVKQLLLLVFLASLGLALWSHWKKDQLPPPEFYEVARLEAPRQTPTDSQPFRIEAEGIHYRIDPLFDYELDGVVVSLHDSDVFWDIYHFQDWKDFINIRDLCVVWGDNVASGVFRDIYYRNSTWTCWASPLSEHATRDFAWNQISNNHLLSHDPFIQEAIKSAEIGDQIHLRGKLARYSHAGGFRRGTSVTRSDRGEGACETIYVEDFGITRKSNPGWRLIHRLSTTIALLALLGLTVIFFTAPFKAPR